MVGWREAVQTCGAVAKVTPIGVKNGGQGGAEIGRESKMGKLQVIATVWFMIYYLLY